MSGSQNDLDWNQFEAITCNFLPEFVDVYREFEVELPKLLKDLEKAIETFSTEQIVSLAHQIKGSAANFGFIRISQEMNTLEQEARQNLLNHAAEYLAAACAAFERTRLEVNSRIAP